VGLREGLRRYPRSVTERYSRKPDPFGSRPKKQNSGNPIRPGGEQTESFAEKAKTPVISRSFNHQSKNEQLIRLFIILILS
jgi:hypothetical protein